MKKMLLACLVQVSLYLTCLAQTNGKTIDSFLVTQMKINQIPGLQLVVMKGSQVVYTASKGFADCSFRVPVNDSTLFSINSISKIFAGVGLMQLAEEGKIRLDDPVGRYLHHLPRAWQPITIRQLMAHISGLPDIEDERTGDLIGGKGEDTAWKLVQRLPMLSKPGEIFYYNATNYLLIQQLLEKYSEQPYEKWVRENQFSRAEMQRTVFANSEDVIENKAAGYTYYFLDPANGNYIKKDQLRQLHEDFPKMLRTDAGAFSTAKELAYWIAALKTGRLIKNPESLRSLWTPARLNNGKTEGFGEISTGYALGWSVMDRKVHPAVAGIGGGRAAILVYPKDDLTVMLLTNLSGCNVIGIADDIAALYFNH